MARRVIDRARTGEIRRCMSYEEYRTWVEDGKQSEWVDGEGIIFMPPKIVHVRLVVFLGRLIGMFNDRFRLGELFWAPCEMRIRDGRSYREPDLLFVAREHLDRVTEERIDGPADLVIEIVSDDSVRRDLVVKADEYATAGVPEYWALDPRPEIRRADFLRLTKEGRYEGVALDAEGRYHSLILPGFWLRPEWLWQDPLPFSIDCLREIAPQVLHPRRPGAAVHAEA